MQTTPAPAQKEEVAVTTCDYCRARFRLRPEHAKLAGKSVRCPKCHRDFILKIERASVGERAAIATQACQEDKKVEEKQPKRRTQVQIRREAVKRIKSGMRKHHGRLSQLAAAEASTEEDVRRWCIDVLREALGYEDVQIDTEMRALNQRIDIALKDGDKVFMVIECKNVRSRLQSIVRDQAVMYAVNKSADWAVITNGQVWKLYRVRPVPGSDPQATLVFDIALLDEDGVSTCDAESLYLLTRRAVFQGESEKIYHRIACLSATRVFSAITSVRVVKAIRRTLCETYRNDADEIVKLEECMVVDRLRELFLPADL